MFGFSCQSTLKNMKYIFVFEIIHGIKQKIKFVTSECFKKSIPSMSLEKNDLLSTARIK